MAFSLDDLDAKKASAKAFEFEYVDMATGEKTGVFLSVLGAESEVVQAAIAAAGNEQRRKQAVKELQKTLSATTQTATYDTVEDDNEYVCALAAARLVGWRGIGDPYSPENALRLVSSNRGVRNQILQNSNSMANFMKL